MWERCIKPASVARHVEEQDMAILSVAGRRSELDASGDESTEFVGESLSSHPEIGAHNRGFSGKRRHPIRAFGRVLAV